MSAAPRTLAARLGRPVDGASLGFFRMAAGALFAVELLNDIANGDFAVIGAPTMHFHYAFFAWVRPAAPVAVHWAVTIGLALAVATGAALRMTAPLLFVSWTWIFLMERSEYVNHTYLYCWITFWLATLPIGDALSIDGARRRSTRAAAPTWVLGLFRFQMAVVYVFSGLAKLDADWLAGIPLDLWLPNPAGPKILVPILSTAAAPIAIAWGGLVFDLAITPLVL